VTAPAFALQDLDLDSDVLGSLGFATSGPQTSEALESADRPRLEEVSSESEFDHLAEFESPRESHSDFSSNWDSSESTDSSN
jgi:hypothetical protein